MRVVLWLAFALFALLSGGVRAQAVTSAAHGFDTFMQQATGAGQSTVSFGTNGTPLASPGNGTLSMDGGLPKYSNSASWRNPQGNPVPVSAFSRVPGPAAAAAVGRFLGKLITPLSYGMAAYDLARELGFLPTPNADGVHTDWSKPASTPAGCGGPPYSPAYIADIISGNPAGGCYGNYSGVYTVVDSIVNQGSQCLITFHCSDGTHYGSLQGYAITGLTSPGTPATQQQFLDAIAAKSGWPSTSSIALALDQAATSTGVTTKVDPSTTTVTGPATSPGTTTTTTDAVKNETTTSTTTNNHTYSGSTINTTTTTQTTTINNTTNSVVNNTTSTTAAPSPNAATPDPQPTCGLPGNPECNVKVDELGTDVDPKLDATKAANDATKDASDLVKNPAAKVAAHPSLSWNFALPTACSRIELPAFAPFLTGIDICQFKPVFHDLMSIVWVLGGLFGAISMFWRNAYSLA